MGEDNVQPSTGVRRKRRIARMVREKTPEPSRHQSASINEEQYPSVNVVCMQICPPRTMSAHQSKILRRRDRNSAAAIASRSHSQPREAEKLPIEQGTELIRITKRSLSIPRKCENDNLPTDETNVDHLARCYKQVPEGSADDQLSRSARNLLRFENDCKQLERERILFERERREHLSRYRQIINNEGMRQMLRCYRKLSDHYITSDTDNKKAGNADVSVETYKENQNFVKNNRLPRYKYHEEINTQISSSETENTEIITNVPRNYHSGRKKENGNTTHFSQQLRKRIPTTHKRLDAQKATSAKKLLPIPMRRQSIKETLPANDTVDFGGQSTLVNVETIEVLKEDKTKDQTNNSFQMRFKNLFRFFEKKKDGKPAFKDFQVAVATNVEDSHIHATHHFLGNFFWFFSEWQNYKTERSAELKVLRTLRNDCFAHLILLILLIGFGGLLFRYTEGTAENVYKCEVRKVKRDFIEQLWMHSHNMREEDWKNLARQKLRKFEEELHNMGELGLRYYPGQRSWNFVNSILFCWTVITTIGYGHITPKTILGQSLTIVYAIIGIPMFLILLADFGKLLTRTIKLLWGYVRRLYYTGTCRKIRKQHQISEVMSGFTVVYDLAVQRPSQCLAEASVAQQCIDGNTSNPDTPTSHYPETIVVDDEFNLPISLASIVLVSYILIGAFVYTLWEDWTYFEAFYFVFVSMSTIGFGDFVPNHPIFMMCSIIYLVFGLALTSMFINVVQIKLSDTFKQASTKIGATIGLTLGGDATDKLSEHISPSVQSVVNYQTNDKTSNSNVQPSTGSPIARLAPSSTNSM